MRRKVLLASLLCLVVASLGFYPTTKASPRPLRKSEVLALVAGDIFPDNIVMEIQADGLAFLPDDEFRSLLTSAGADPSRAIAAAAAVTASPFRTQSSL